MSSPVLIGQKNWQNTRSFCPYALDFVQVTSHKTEHQQPQNLRISRTLCSSTRREGGARSYKACIYKPQVDHPLFVWPAVVVITPKYRFEPELNQCSSEVQAKC